MSSSSWQGYMCFVNGWQEDITSVTLNHLVGGSIVEKINLPTLNEGDVSNVVAITAYDNQDDGWQIYFTDSKGVEQQAIFDNEGFKNEDEGATLVAQITKHNGRATLYFPVSSDAHTSVEETN